MKTRPPLYATHSQGGKATNHTMQLVLGQTSTQSSGGNQFKSLCSAQHWHACIHKRRCTQQVMSNPCHGADARALTQRQVWAPALSGMHMQLQKGVHPKFKLVKSKSYLEAGTPHTPAQGMWTPSTVCAPPKPIWRSSASY